MSAIARLCPFLPPEDKGEGLAGVCWDKGCGACSVCPHGAGPDHRDVPLLCEGGQQGYLRLSKHSVACVTFQA